MAARYLAGELRVASASACLKFINYCILLVLNYSNASLALPNIIAHPDADFLAIMLLIVLALCISAFFIRPLASGVGWATKTYSARANTKTSTCLAPPRNNARDAALAVAPEVITSSISTIDRPSMRAVIPSETLPAD